MNNTVIVEDVSGDACDKTWHYYNFIVKHLKFVLRHDKDIVFLSLMMTLVSILLPFILYFYFFPHYFSWIIAVFYWLIWWRFMVGPFVLMLHATSHRNIFKKKYYVLNYFLRDLLGIFFGLTYESYFAHHLVMHHFENNGLKDQSGTMSYKRDSFVHWLHYMIKFAALGYLHLLAYFIKTKKYKTVKKMLVNDALYFLFIIGLAYLNFHATFVLFIFPYFIIRILLMAGNWGQHAFVDINDSKNPYKQSVTLINTAFNAACFNDGYHVVHHVKPGLHWLEVPEEFRATMDLYNQHDAIVFTHMNAGFIEVWLYLMLKRYDKLADKMPAVGVGRYEREKRISIMKQRTQEQGAPIKGLLDFNI